MLNLLLKPTAWNSLNLPCEILLLLSVWLTFIGDKKVGDHDAPYPIFPADHLKVIKSCFRDVARAAKIDDGTSVGMCGLLKREGLNYPDLGFAIFPEHEKKGQCIRRRRSQS
jgi:hypothetical protein